MKRQLRTRALGGLTIPLTLERKILNVPGAQRALEKLTQKGRAGTKTNDPLFVLTHITNVLLKSRSETWRPPFDWATMPYDQRRGEFHHTLRTVQTLISKIKRLEAHKIVMGAMRDFAHDVKPLDLKQFVADLHRCEFMLKREIENCVFCMEYSKRLEDLCIRFFVAGCQNPLMSEEPRYWKRYPEMATALNAAFSVLQSKRKFTPESLRKFIRKHAARLK